MEDCSCDVCSLLRWLNKHVDGAADRAIPALAEALWRVIAEAESDTQSQIHQAIFDLGIDPHTFQMLRSAAKLTSWELSAAADDTQEPDEGKGQQPVLH